MHAFDVLEFGAIKERLQGHCETALGGVLASELTPVFHAAGVWELLALTGEGHEALAKHQVPSLGPVRDLRQPLKIASKGGVLGGQELFLIADALMAMRVFKTFLAARRIDMPKLSPLAESLP